MWYRHGGRDVSGWLFGFFFQAEDGIRDYKVTGVQTCALPISRCRALPSTLARPRRAKRDSEGMVAAFTPKKGTKTESLRPKSMSGKRYSSPPLRRLEMIDRKSVV